MYSYQLNRNGRLVNESPNLTIVKMYTYVAISSRDRVTKRTYPYPFHVHFQKMRMPDVKPLQIL